MHYFLCSDLERLGLEHGNCAIGGLCYKAAFVGSDEKGHCRSGMPRTNCTHFLPVFPNPQGAPSVHTLAMLTVIIGEQKA